MSSVEMEMDAEGDDAVPTIVGITAPTKEDWSNEFELADDNPFLNNLQGASGDKVITQAPTPTSASTPAIVGGRNDFDENYRRLTGYALANRSHSRRVVRSLDWGKLQQLHLGQHVRKREDTSPLPIFEEPSGSEKSTFTYSLDDSGDGFRVLTSNVQNETDQSNRHSIGTSTLRNSTKAKTIPRRTQTLGSQINKASTMPEPISKFTLHKEASVRSNNSTTSENGSEKSLGLHSLQPLSPSFSLSPGQDAFSEGFSPTKRAIAEKFEASFGNDVGSTGSSGRLSASGGSRELLSLPKIEGESSDRPGSRLRDKTLEPSASFRSCESTDSVSVRKIRRQQVARGQYARIAAAIGKDRQGEILSANTEGSTPTDTEEGDTFNLDNDDLEGIESDTLHRQEDFGTRSQWPATSFTEDDATDTEALEINIHEGLSRYTSEQDDDYFRLVRVESDDLPSLVSKEIAQPSSVNVEDEQRRVYPTKLSESHSGDMDEVGSFSSEHFMAREQGDEVDMNGTAEDGDDDGSSLSSVSDWDAMLEEEGEAQSGSPPNGQLGTFQQHLEDLRNFVGEQLDDSATGNIPTRWRLASLIKEKKAAPTVIRYPKPSALFSLRTKDGMRFMQETALERWLNQLLEDNKTRKDAFVASGTPHDDGENNKKKYRSLLGKSIPGSQRWIENFLSLIWTYYVSREDGFCSENAMRMFRMLGSAASADKSKRRMNRANSSFDSSSTSSVRTLSVSPEKRFFMRKMPRSTSSGTNDQLLEESPQNTCGSEAEEDPSEEDYSWDRFLSCVLHCFHLGTIALARTGEAFAAGDIRRSRGTSRESVPSCVLSMVSELRKWVESKVPTNIQRFTTARLKLLEAEGAAHQLATCVLDFPPPGGANSNVHVNADTLPLPLKGRRSSRDGLFGMGRRFSHGSDEGDDVSTHSAPSPLMLVSNIGGSTQNRSWDFIYHPPTSSATGFLSNEAQLAEAVLAQFCNVYLEMVECEKPTEEEAVSLSEFPDGDPLLIQADCLCDMQLVLLGMSPLTTTETNKLQDALDQLQLELEDWMTSDDTVESEVLEIVAKCEAFAPAHAPSLSKDQDRDESGIGMCIGVVHQNLANQQSIIEYERLCGVDPRYRMEKLEELYPCIPSSVFQKAKTAFVLAMYAWDENRDAEKAEELLFECLFVLESLKTAIPQCNDFSLLSELATNSMVMYGDILVENAKYKYAIGAYEAAVRSYKLREKNDFKWLYRRLCSICVEHMDWDRALKYHLEILHTTKLDTNLNEFVYVSERVAMILLDQRADFSQAESYLKLALSYLGTRRSASLGTGLENAETLQVSLPNRRNLNLAGGIQPVATPSAAFAASVSSLATPSSSSDAHHRSLRMKLQQRLAHVYLAANRAEDAARLLSQVIGVSPSATMLSPVSGHHLNMFGFGSGHNHPTTVQQSGSILSSIAEADNAQSSASRCSVLLLLAKACLKLRWLADCTAALDQLGNEVLYGKWCDPNYSTSMSGVPVTLFARPRPTRGMMRELLVVLIAIGGETAMSYAILRAKCCLYQGQLPESLDWIDETLCLAGVDPSSAITTTPSSGSHGTDEYSNTGGGFGYASMNGKNPRGPALGLTLGQLGRLYYYKGKILQLGSCPTIMQEVDGNFPRPIIEKRCGECGKTVNREGEYSPNTSAAIHSCGLSGTFGKTLSVSSAFCNDLKRGLLESKSQHPSHIEGDIKRATRAFWSAFEYFQLIDDALWQAKALSRISQVELSRIFSYENSNDVQAVTGEDFKTTLTRIEETASMAIDLCADIGYGPLMLRCLLNMAEVYSFQGRSAEAWLCWQETRQLLNMIYLTTTVSSSPGEELASSSMASSSFSFAETNASARLEVEQALSMFMMLSNNKDVEARPNEKSSGPLDDLNGNEFYQAPDTRVPGIHTPPGLTFRILQHVTRLVRLLFHDKAIDNAEKAVSLNLDLLTTWNWLSDECWKQFTFCSKVVLPEHVRTSLYDEYLIAYSYRGAMRNNNSAPTVQSHGDDIASMLRNDLFHSSQSPVTAGPTKQKKSLDPNVISTTDSQESSDSAPGGRNQTHRRNKSDSAVGGGISDVTEPKVRDHRGVGTGPYSKQQRERIRQLRQQIQYDEEGCKRCRMARQAELLTTEGRTNIALWSCFHRLKLLAHGEIGLSLLMEEVHSQNVELLRKIRDLTKANHLSTHKAKQARAKEAAEGQSPQPLFRLPLRQSSSVDGSTKRSIHFAFSLFCGWERDLVSIVQNRVVASKSRNDSSEHSLTLNAPVVQRFKLSPDYSCGGLELHQLESNVFRDEDLSSEKSTLDPHPTMYGVWEVMRSISDRDLFRLISIVLSEQPLLIVSTLTSVRSRAIEAILGLIRPFRWLHLISRNLPATLAFVVGKLSLGATYMFGLHPCAVADFVAGIEYGFLENEGGTTTIGAKASQVNRPVLPTILNVDDGWIEFSPHAGVLAPLLPASFQSVLVAFLSMASGSSVDGSKAGQKSPPSSPPAVDFPNQKPTMLMSLRSDTISKPMWGVAAFRSSQELFKAMNVVMLWLLRFYTYFYDSRSQSFDVEQFCNGMRVEDPKGLFSKRFVETRMFAHFLRESEARKSLSRMKLDDLIEQHMRAKAKIYRALVGLTRGCWVWMVVLDHTLENDSDGHLNGIGGGGSSSSSTHRRSSPATMFGSTAVAAASSGKGGKDGSQWTSLFSSFGMATSYQKQPVSVDTTVSRVAEDIQQMQLFIASSGGSSVAGRKVSSGSVKGGVTTGIDSFASQGAKYNRAGGPNDVTLSGNSQGEFSSLEGSFHDMSSFFQAKPKRKWIYLEEKRIRYHYRKSKTREKGSIPLDPARTRLVVPVDSYFRKDISSDYSRLQATLDRTRKQKPDDVIEDPRPGRDDSHWIYLVTQLKDSNKARTIKLRFMDKCEEQLWMDALRVKLMNPELLIRLLETAYVLQE